MTMDAEKMAKVEEYIHENEQTQWFWKLAETVADLTWIEEETKKTFFTNWLKNDEKLLRYAELNDHETQSDLNAKEMIEYGLLSLRLVVSCPYFKDFKIFLEELKKWSDTSNKTSTESTETQNNTFCWTNVWNIKSESAGESTKIWVTWCSKTTYNNWKKFWLTLPMSDPYIAWQKPWVGCLWTLPSDRTNDELNNEWDKIKYSDFISWSKWNCADIYIATESKYWFRALAFKDDSWEWFVLDPYTRVNWKLDTSPKKLEDYFLKRNVIKANFYESKWYIPNNQEVADNPQVEDAVQWAIAIAENNCHGYERWGKWKNWQYDCSGLVTNAFKHAWFNVPISWTATMRENFSKAWFERISPYDSSKLQRWDILLKDIWKDGQRHTEIYTWNWKYVWARSNKDWKSGDSSWNEIAESGGNWLKNFGWNGILRYRW